MEPTSPSPSATAPQSPLSPPESPPESPSENPQDSYVKLAMRNMVRKSGKSIFHFILTTLAILGLLVGLAYLSR